MVSLYENRTLAPELPLYKRAPHFLSYNKGEHHFPLFYKGAPHFFPFSKAAPHFLPFNKGAHHFPPFVKGGLGGIYCQDLKIPLDPHFSKGEGIQLVFVNNIIKGGSIGSQNFPAKAE